jgi:hypothetical protein
MATETPLPTLPVTITDPSDREARQRLASRARGLTQLSLAWHALEAAVAIAAGVIAGSVALVGFGADSVIEAGAGLVVLWLVTGDRLSSHRAERRAQQLIAASFLVLALYVTIESALLRELRDRHPGVVVRIGLGIGHLAPVLALIMISAVGAISVGVYVRHQMRCPAAGADEGRCRCRPVITPFGRDGSASRRLRYGFGELA